MSRRIFALLVIGTFVAWAKAQDNSPQVGKIRTRPIVEAKAMTLAEMTKAADIVFVGRVESVLEQDFELKDNEKTAKVHGYVITFQITHKLKGDIEEGAKLDVRQLRNAYSPVKPGEEVLWYLSKPGKSGFTAPMGLYSGNFKIEPDPTDPNKKVVRNLVNNQGLWSNSASGSLMQELSQVSNRVHAQFTEKLRAKDMTKSRSDRILQASQKPNRPGALPLELITTATESLLSVQ